MSDNTPDQMTLAKSLLGKVVRFNHMVEPWGKVIDVKHDGLVEVYGHGGYFAPHLFQVVEEHEHIYEDDLVCGPEVVGKACSICGLEMD